MSRRLCAAAPFFTPPKNLRKNLHQLTIPLDSASRAIYIVLQERVALRRTRASRPEKGAIHEEKRQEGR